MNQPDSPAAELALVDIDDQEDLAAWVARHALGPVRRMLGIPAPDPSEGLEAPPAPPFSTDVTQAAFGPAVAGLAIWSGLYPHAAPSFGELESLGRHPASAWLDGAYFLGLWVGYGEVRRQVAGLFGPELEPGDPRLSGDVRFHREPRRNDAGLAELRRMQALLLRLYGDPDEWDDLLVREEIGLRHVDLEAAWELDRILRRDVHRRIVRMGTDEPVLPGEVDGEAHDLRVDGGVFAASVPETLSGALALDYLEGLESQRRVARCAGCRRALVVSNQQAARVAKGQPVYHADCKGEARLTYFRSYQRRRRGAAVG